MARLYPPAPPPPAEDPKQPFTSGLWQRWISGLSQALTASTVGGGSTAYQNVTGARAAGTAYPALTNAVAVSILVNLGAAGDTASLQVGGLTVAQVKSNGTVAVQVSLGALVPKGATYRLVLAGAAAVGIWYEL